MNDNFEKMNLSEKMKENLVRLGYTKLTTIQEKVIPVVLAGNDLIGQSRTGTGKTAAFLIPIIESLEPDRSTQAIILAPTRELAIQIKEEGLKLAWETNINIVAVFGGDSIENQIYQLKKKAEIVVGTPGRILDHLERKTLKFDSLKFFVLDEVDEMLKRGFIDDINLIAKKAKSDNLQTLFFSATISRETQNLSDNFLKKPVFINNSQKDEATKPLISQYYLTVKDGRNKLATLVDIIHFQNPELAIIFAGTKRMVDIISDELSSGGFSVDKIHSDLSQSKRTAVYNNFKNKRIRFLIATDIAARGIDIEGVSHVYNYDFPQDPEFYIHRIGRTGRAGLSGQSVILLSNWETRRQVPFLERLTGEKIQQIYQPSQEEIDEIIENSVLEKVTGKIEEAKSRKLSEKAAKLLQTYTSEEILAGIISTFSVKKRRVVQNSEQERRREGRNSNFRDSRNERNNNRSRPSWKNSFSNERKYQKSNSRYDRF